MRAAMSKNDKAGVSTSRTRRKLPPVAPVLNKAEASVDLLAGWTPSSAREQRRCSPFVNASRVLPAADSYGGGAMSTSSRSQTTAGQSRRFGDEDLAAKTWPGPAGSASTSGRRAQTAEGSGSRQPWPAESVSASFSPSPSWEAPGSLGPSPAWAAQRTTYGAVAGTTASDDGNGAAVDLVLQVQELAVAVEQKPSVLLAARALDALVNGLVPPDAPQYHILKELRDVLETPIYGVAGDSNSSTVETAVEETSQAPPRNAWTDSNGVLRRFRSARSLARMDTRQLEKQEELSRAPKVPPGIVPQRYKGRAPFFVIARRQRAQMEEMQERMCYLDKVIQKAEQFFAGHAQLQAMAKTAKESAGAHRAIQSAASAMFRNSVNEASLIWIFGFWKFVHHEVRKNKRKKQEVLNRALIGDLAQPFMHWQIFVTESQIRAEETTAQAFLHEREMLAFNVRELEQQAEETRSELEMSDGTARRLQIRLDAVVRQRVALKARFTAAQPELVRSVLSSVLNSVFSGALHEAQHSKMMARQVLETRELAVLLAQEEECVKKLATLPSDALLGRWVNYHLMQFRILAIEVLDNIAKARNEEAVLGGDSKASEWSTSNEKTKEIYSDRCRQVRSLQKIANFHEDLRDGQVLSVLYAALCGGSSMGVMAGGGASSGAAGQNPGGLTPAALWLLDERDPEVRAQKLCTAFRQLLPTQAAQCILRPSDITRGNPPAIAMLFAALFIHCSRLPSTMPENKVLDFVGSVDGETERIEWNSEEDNPPPDASRKPVLLSSSTVASGLAASRTLRKEDFQSSGGAEAAPQVEEQPPIRQVVLNMERAASECAYDTLQDFGQLARAEEAPNDITRLSPEELVLRWVNAKLNAGTRGGRRGSGARRLSKGRRNSGGNTGYYDVQNMQELKGGKMILEMLKGIAADVLGLLQNVMPEARMVMNDKGTEEHVIVVVVECANRCTSFPILTREAVREGQADVIAAFLAGLFLCRPSLPVKPGSTLHRHVELIATTVKGGPASVSNRFADRCAWLKDTSGRFSKALESVQSAQDLHQEVDQVMYSFMADILAQRAQGAPCKVLGMGTVEPQKHLQESLRATMLNGDHLQAILKQQSPFGKLRDYDEQVTEAELIEDILRKNCHLLREMFRNYAKGPGSARAQEKQANKEARRGSQLHRKSRFSRVDLRNPSIAMNSGRNMSQFGFNRGRANQRELDSKAMYVDLRSLTRVYEDCRLRRLKVNAADVEVVYHQVIEEVTGDDPSRQIVGALQQADGSDVASNAAAREAGGLGFESFIEALVILSCRSQLPASYWDETGDCSDKLSYVVEKHFWPFANRYRRKEDFFYATAYDPAVEDIITQVEAPLRIVFESYSQVSLGDKLGNIAPKMASQTNSRRTSGIDDVDDLPSLPPAPSPSHEDRDVRKESIVNELPSFKTGRNKPGFRSNNMGAKKINPGRTIEVYSFQSILRDVDIFNGALSDAAVRSIFRGVQHVLEDDVEEDEMDDDEDESDEEDSDEEEKERSSSGSGSFSSRGSDLALPDRASSSRRSSVHSSKYSRKQSDEHDGGQTSFRLGSARLGSARVSIISTGSRGTGRQSPFMGSGSGIGGTHTPRPDPRKGSGSMGLGSLARAISAPMGAMKNNTGAQGAPSPQRSPKQSFIAPQLSRGMTENLSSRRMSTAIGAPSPAPGGAFGAWGSLHMTAADPCPLAFNEFINALIAVVLYHDPNPFVPFVQRFERFVDQTLFEPLQEYWEKKNPHMGLAKELGAALKELPPSKYRNKRQRVGKPLPASRAAATPEPASPNSTQQSSAEPP